MIDVCNVKYELMTDGQKKRQMCRFAGSCWFVYNKVLELQKDCYEQGEKKSGCAGLCKMLTELRNNMEATWRVDFPYFR
ncbi:helix-turn-helix domain-containing protein [Escherichia coli]|nr:helix-turn-helix domain-containing protein [Escherichia coli]